MAQWTGQFTLKHGAENLLRLDGESAGIADVVDAVASAPFIAEKRLVVVRRIPRATKEDVDRILAAIHPAVILVFVDAEPDKRLGGVKMLLQIAEIREHPVLRSAQLRQWIAGLLQQYGATMLPTAIDHLIAVVGEDQQMLFMELQKLALYCADRPIDIAAVDALVVYQGERQVWALMDLLQQGSPGPAIRYVQSLLDRGESIQGLWAMVLWMLGTVAPIAAACSNSTNPMTIAKETGINPRTVRSILPLVRSHSLNDVREIVHRVVEYDMALKTGELRASDSEPQELTIALDRVLIACCSARQRL